MESITQTLKDKKFLNWLKGALAIRFTKQGLDGFVETEITQFQNDLLAYVFTGKTLSAGTGCNSCTTANVLTCRTPNFCPDRGKCFLHDELLEERSANRACPNNICQRMRDGISSEHRYMYRKGPSWRNTDARKWCSDPFQIAKCYMPADGYFEVRSLAETDFNGTLSVIMNNKRFEHKMDADLDQAVNICTKAREVGREIRHAADLSVSDEEVARYIDILICLLSDKKHLSSDPKAIEALNKLNQLKAQTLTITTEDIVSVLDEEIKAIVVKNRDKALQEIGAKKDEVQKKVLDNIKDALHNMQTVTLNNLDQIVARKLHEFKEEAEKEKESLRQLSEEGKQLMEEIRRGKGAAFTSVASSSFGSKEVEKCLQEDLIQFYRKFHSTIPVSPIVEENDVPLIDLYVQPPLLAINIEKTLGVKESNTKKLPVHTFRDIFYRTDEQQYKDIYITAKAGVGKTSFVKRISMIWCQAHSPDREVHGKFHPEDVAVMKAFDFLFVVCLRDTHPSVCGIDDMIKRQVVLSLARYHHYKEIFLDILQRSKCLIVLDGLDEWCHPESCQVGFRHVHDLPHRPARDSCTILTTTRPWMMDVLKLGRNTIDRHVEISVLDKASSDELISNAVTLLNKHSLSEKLKTVEEFLINASSLALETVRYIPYILLQMVCLWFDGESIGRSKCEIYGKILQLTLSRGLTRRCKDLWSPLQEQCEKGSLSIPLCLQTNQLCIDYYELLLKLGRIAFETLFCPQKESRVVFDASVVLKRMPERDLMFCLQMGLLSQNKEFGKVASRRRTFSFQHKSVQEYLAALFLQSNFDCKDVEERLRSVCSSLAGVLEMSNTFIFLGGLNPTACGKVLQILKDVVSSDTMVQTYRDNLLIKEYGLTQFWRYREAIRTFQSMQVDIAQEIQNSGQNVFPFYIEDIVVDMTVEFESYQLLKILLSKNNAEVMSLYVRDLESTERFTELLETTGLEQLHSLEKLVLIAVPRQQDLFNLISKSVRTLKCLRLSFLNFIKNLYCNKETTVTHEVIQTISDIDTLQALMLSNICLSHRDVQELFETISRRTTMTEIGLYNISCIDHGSQCGGHKLDLSQHHRLVTLNLDNIPLSNLQVNPASLNECLIGEDKSSVFSSWFSCLSYATKLHTLWFRRMTPVLLDNLSEKLRCLVHLSKFGIEISDLRNTALMLSPDTNIKSVYFYKVAMNSKGFKLFIESLGLVPHSVKVTLEWCVVTPEKEYLQIKDEVIASQTYKVMSNGQNFRHQEQFEFETIKNTELTK